MDLGRGVDLHEFADYIKGLSGEIGFRVSARGWAYLLETRRLINKDEFDRVNSLINQCRKKGLLPINFVAEDSARLFQGVEIPASVDVISDLGEWLRASVDTAENYHLDWWDGEEFYIQMVVEKVDLVTLFSPICREYHIPIANAKGWSSILQRAQYARRFLEAERQGLKCIFLYCGDHDPDGLRISDFIRKNLVDIQQVRWSDGTPGYSPFKLVIERFGLNYDFIEQNQLTWIDNLITGSGLNLASPAHRNYKMEYVQQYLKEIGERKCEANAVVTMPAQARNLVRGVIEGYLGEDALDRFEEKRQVVRDQLDGYLESTGIGETLDGIIEKIESRD